MLDVRGWRTAPLTTDDESATNAASKYATLKGDSILA